ncbi:sensor histidine kinase [Nocardia fluminea]|uniref:histidine kinase n=1 Tax=Nocardia fluminea TaxID=134984 RepID=A0A2N3VJU1_9NOCA|nr:histidine kinase [Nocardia fluminea]PKV81889.1 signal transduction histidine kinase [Nocardia fluminea]
MAELSPEATPLRRLADVALVVAVGGIDLAAWGGDRQLLGGGSLPLWVVPTAAVLLCTTLLARGRFPVTVWAVAWCFTAVNIVVPTYFPVGYLLVATFAAACRVSAPAARLILAGSALSLGLFTYHNRLAGAAAPELRHFLVAGTMWALALGVAWGVGRLLYLREHRALATQARLAADAEAALIAQRLRLAHELHDSVSGAVAAMILHAAAARAFTPDGHPKVAEALAVIENAGTQAMSELHDLLGLLRAPIEGSHAAHAGRSAPATLESLIELNRAGGLRIRLDTDGTRPPNVDPDIDLAAYRLVQESLTNVAKHAGAGATVDISIGWRRASVTVAVRSRGGNGPVPQVARLSTHQGLAGLAQRLQTLSGTVEYGPDGTGWSVVSEIPLNPAGIQENVS